MFHDHLVQMPYVWQWFLSWLYPLLSVHCRCFVTIWQMWNVMCLHRWIEVTTYPWYCGAMDSSSSFQLTANVCLESLGVSFSSEPIFFSKSFFPCNINIFTVFRPLLWDSWINWLSGWCFDLIHFLWRRCLSLISLRSSWFIGIPPFLSRMVIQLFCWNKLML